jgi:tetrahydromethanopterin S-methyltransferase subunit G
LIEKSLDEMDKAV